MPRRRRRGLRRSLASNRRRCTPFIRSRRVRSAARQAAGSHGHGARHPRQGRQRPSHQRIAARLPGCNRGCNRGCGRLGDRWLLLRRRWNQTEFDERLGSGPGPRITGGIRAAGQEIVLAGRVVIDRLAGIGGRSSQGRFDRLRFLDGIHGRIGCGLGAGLAIRTSGRLHCDRRCGFGLRLLGVAITGAGRIRLRHRAPRIGKRTAEAHAGIDGGR
ncbi:MAG TPA: hypothetical protein PK403_07410, partial [Plasticicumulans sp.]|nr:hypothetical protein [Plasticicumulans sp.]